ncbi:hypothetical protein ONS96_006712 [Cadophora gregata f. sp. sojae]|nr:hypothetical protein ONS96_006712 [Cadophora gregata f. sp. sojae]
MDDTTLESLMNIDCLFSECQTPSRPRSSKKTEKLTARKIREAQQKSLSFHSKRLCLHSDWDYIRSREEDFPFQREAVPARDSILALKNNPSYSQSGIIQSYGKVNLGDDVCSCCARVFASGRTRSWKGCVSFPIDLKYPGRAPGSVPFLGQCANCHWGSQGWKCSLRVGGVKEPPRRQRADLFQSSVFQNTHLGNKHDMNTMEGCINARNELQGIMNQVSRRITQLQNEREVDPVGEENARYDEDDDDSYVGSTNSRSVPQAPPTPRPRRRGTSCTPRTPRTPRPSSRKVVASIEDDDDSDYVGPRSTKITSHEKSNRRTRQCSRFPSPPLNSRIEVVIPSFRPSIQRSTRKASSIEDKDR